MLAGLHHITAIAGDPQKNVEFYTQVLGLRLVKRTVNFDDPGSYHFYFGDHEGAPGTLLTFFAWPTAPQGTGRSGTVHSGRVRSCGRLAVRLAPQTGVGGSRIQRRRPAVWSGVHLFSRS